MRKGRGRVICGANPPAAISAIVLPKSIPASTARGVRSSSQSINSSDGIGTIRALKVPEAFRPLTDTIVVRDWGLLRPPRLLRGAKALRLSGIAIGRAAKPIGLRT